MSSHPQTPLEAGTFPRVEALIDMLFDWFKHRREANEICRFEAHDLERIAHELGVSAADLEMLVQRGHNAADELPKLMKTLQLDPQAIMRTQALVMHDMERVCAQCGQKRRCNDELKLRTSAANYADYCRNAATLQGLGAKEVEKKSMAPEAVSAGRAAVLFP